nr:hypothetical protein [Massilistercora timonensis]
MLDLTFGEQVKIVLGRRGMTIKDLAEEIEERTGKKMSRQNLTQRLGRDNFQEQDMRMIAGILGCPFRLDILGEEVSPSAELSVERETFAEEPAEEAVSEEEFSLERDITIGELVDINQQLDELESEEEPEEESLEAQEPPVEELLEEMEEIEREAREQSRERALREERLEQERQAHGWKAYLQRMKHRDGEEKPEEPEEIVEEAAAEEAVQEPEAVKEEPAQEEPLAVEEEEEDLVKGDVNPYTGREYKSNSVRMHPKRIGYVQVYDRGEHKWTDMTEWAFLGYQERKKALLGKDYEPPIYLD